MRLHRVPWVRQPAEFHRPSRRVSPVRQRGIWTLRPDTLAERLENWLWPRFREVVAWAFCIAVGALLAYAFVWRLVE